MTSRALFPTTLYEAAIDDAGLIEELDASVRALAEEDRAGRGWSKEHGYRGYTSYASLNDLPLRDPVFADLKRMLDKHAARFAAECGMELAGRKLKLDSLWVNLLKPGGGHSGHVHPHSVVSGTFYVAVPEGAGGIRFEDPRLGLLMAAPTRPGTFETVRPHPGTLLLWESWLRHEVLPHAGKGERISVSFNYRW
ncbi:TIGR02466 family protein [Sphingomonas sp. Leaf25]|uniref:TIGR02466 family protein n=1 Tax=Sphingomonas sp. Leaf25 TaxID=1735692 RepID=UPI00070105C4|nr:TIGR02466 family protein [Sphingomonas sp. Leaf25]KQN07214.1 hypothetical protein ASE78_13410 [Sphingomonas sp. Leaf25]